MVLMVLMEQFHLSHIQDHNGSQCSAVWFYYCRKPRKCPCPVGILQSCLLFEVLSSDTCGHYCVKGLKYLFYLCMQQMCYHKTHFSMISTSNSTAPVSSSVFTDISFMEAAPLKCTSLNFTTLKKSTLHYTSLTTLD